MARPRSKRSVPCPRCGYVGVVCHGFDKNGRQGYKCRRCRLEGRLWTFNKRTGTPLYRLRTSVKEIVQVVQSYMECGSVEGVARTFQRAASTITRWTERIAQQCAKVNNALIKNLEVLFVQLDELWSYVKKKENEQWVWNPIDPQTKLMIAFQIGPWTKKISRKLIKLLKKRIKAIWALISDGLDHYVKQIVRRNIFTFVLYYAVGGRKELKVFQMFSKRLNG